MNQDILILYDKIPAALPLYEAAEAKTMLAFPDAKSRISKTQIGYFTDMALHGSGRLSAG